MVHDWSLSHLFSRLGWYLHFFGTLVIYECSVYCYVSKGQLPLSIAHLFLFVWEN